MASHPINQGLTNEGLVHLQPLTATIWHRVHLSAHHARARTYRSRALGRQIHGQTAAANTPSRDVKARKRRYRYHNESWSHNPPLTASGQAGQPRSDDALMIPGKRGPGFRGSHAGSHHDGRTAVHLYVHERQGSRSPKMRTSSNGPGTVVSLGRPAVRTGTAPRSYDPHDTPRLAAIQAKRRR